MFIKAVFLCVLAIVSQEMLATPPHGDLKKLSEYTDKNFEKKDKLLGRLLKKQVHFHIQDHHYHYDHHHYDQKGHENDRKEHYLDHHDLKKHDNKNHYLDHYYHLYGHHKNEHAHTEDARQNTKKENSHESHNIKDLKNNSSILSNTEKPILSNQLTSLSDSYNLLQRALEASSSVSSTQHPIEHTDGETKTADEPSFRPLPDYNIGEFTNNFVHNSWKSSN